MRALVVFMAVFFMQQATAAVTVDIFENGGDVQATLSGSLNLDATQGFSSTSTGFDGYLPTTGNVSFTSANSEYYNVDFSSWTPFGDGAFGTWDSSSGDAWHMFSNPVIGVPVGYVSGNALSASATKNTTTLAALGFTTGTYVTTLTNGQTTDTVTVNIGTGGPVILADLTISKSDSIDPVSAGNELTYTLRVDNIGLATADNVVVTDILPAGVTLVSTTGCSEDPVGVPTCSLGSIDTIGFAEYTVTVAVDPSTRGIITNNASVTTSSEESNLDNNSTSEDTAVVAVSDLSITKIASSNVVGSGGGQTLDYTIEVSNIGPSDAANVLVTDTLSPLVTFGSTAGCLNDPDGVPQCQLGTIAVGASASYTISVTLLRADGTLVNAASVDSDSFDPNDDNSTAVEVVEVNAIAIPTLGILGLALLILLMGGLGWMNTRRV